MSPHLKGIRTYAIACMDAILRQQGGLIRLMPRRRLLLTEGDPSNTQLIEKICQLEGYEVIRVDGVHFRDVALGGVHLVILDIGRRFWEGLDLIQTVRVQNAACPILVVTSWVDAARLEAFSKAGAVAVVTKPFGRCTLVNAIRDAHHDG